MKMRIILFSFVCVHSIYSMESASLVSHSGQSITAADIAILSNSFGRTTSFLHAMKVWTIGWAVVCVGWAAYRAEDLKVWETLAMLASTGGPAAIVWLSEQCCMRTHQAQEILARLRAQYAPA